MPQTATLNGHAESVFAPRLGDEGDACASCGALLAPDQRYCLSCGQRRAGTRVPFPAPAVAALAPVRQLPRRGSSIPPWAGIAAVAALGFGMLVGVLFANGNDDPPAPQVITQAPTATATAATPTAVPTSAPAETPTAVPTTFTPDWPSGTNGWTVQLQTLPKDATTPDQVNSAKADATGKGAADVGALDSDSYPTLDGGNYVIYSGVDTSKADAQTALDGLKANFPDAKVVEVSDTKPAATPTFSSPDEAQKKLRNSPDKVKPKGTPPPTDNKQPGGDDPSGGDATEIG